MGKLAGAVFRMAHLRRKFFDARKQAHKSSITVLLKIQEIYRVERDLKLSNALLGCREMIRRSRSLPLLKELKTLIDGIEKKNLGPKQAWQSAHLRSEPME